MIEHVNQLLVRELAHQQRTLEQLGQVSVSPARPGREQSAQGLAHVGANLSVDEMTSVLIAVVGVRGNTLAKKRQAVHGVIAASCGPKLRSAHGGSIPRQW